jgi:hypothetical protein
MTQRRVGPVQGPGVAVVELDGDHLLQPAPLGIGVLFGKFRKGDTDELNWVPTRGDFLKKMGDYVDGSECPDAAFDFYNLGAGRGELYCVRLTDGTEVASDETFYGQQSGHGYRYGYLADATWNDKKKALLKVTAHNGGHWGGRAKVLTGSVGSVSNITATTLTSGLTMLQDQYKGATLRLKGVTAKTYVVQSNSSAGVFTANADAQMHADLVNGSDPTQTDWEVVLEQEIQAFPTSKAGTRRALSVVFKDGQESETELFGMTVYEDESIVYDLPNLSMDPTSKWYAPNVINQDTSNFWIQVTDLYSGSYDSHIRPTDWYGMAFDWSSDTVTVPIAHVRSVTSVNADPGHVGMFTLPSPARVKKQRITITFTGATTYTVSSDAAEGAKHTALPAGTVGTAYAADNRHTIGFTVFAGNQVWTAGDTIVIDVLPLPVDEDGNGLLVGGYLYYNLDSDPRARLQIKSNTSNTVTLVSAPGVAPTEMARATGKINTGTLTFPLTVADNAFALIHSGFGLKTVTVAGSPFASAAALVTAINTAWHTASGGTGNIATAGVSPSNSIDLSLDDSGTDTERGYESFMIVGTNASSDLGLTAGAHVVGTLGSHFRIQAPAELRRGYDGLDPTDANYITATSPASDSLVSHLFGQNKGLVKLATPGKTATAIQQAYLQLAEAYFYEYRIEIPSNTTDDGAAVAFINDTIGRNDFGIVSFPSYAYVKNPVGNGTVLRSLTGALWGREALVANNIGGYEKVPAGIDVTLPNIISLPTGSRVLNEEILTPAGINTIKKLHGNFVSWGARTTALNPDWKFRQKRELASHYARQFLEGFDYIIFSLNDKRTWGSLKTTFRAFFTPEFVRGAIRGDTFEDACLILIGDANNSALTMANGDLNATVKVRLADTTERLIISLGQAGVFEDLG